MTAPIVKRFFVSFDKNKYIGIAVSCAVMGAATVLAMQPPDPPPPKQFAASGVLRYSSPPPLATETGRNLAEQGQMAMTEDFLVDNAILTEGAKVADMLDQPAKKFIEKLKFDIPEAEGEGEGGGEGEAIPQMINITYTDKDPERAAKTIETLLKLWVEKSRNFNTAQLRSQIEALKKRSQEAKQELQIAERQFYEFMSQQGSSMLTAQDGSLFEGISVSEQEQRALQQQIEGLQSQIDNLVSRLNLTPEQAATAAALSADPIIAQLRAQIHQTETEKKMLEKELRPAHPKMEEIEKNLNSYNALLVERANELIGNDNVFQAAPKEIRQESSLDPTRQQMANQIIQLDAQKDSLVRQLQVLRENERELRQDYEQFPTKQLEMSRLQQQLGLKKKFFDELQARLVDAQSAEAETAGNLAIAQPVEVTEVEQEVKEPLNPIIIIMAGGVGSVVAGGIVILALSFLDPRLHTASEIRALLSEREIMVLGELPWLMQLQEDSLPILTGVNTPYLDHYEQCRSTLRRTAPKNSKVVLFTSVAREEGKSSAAYNLAIASAYAGKRTLLIEADMRSPSHIKTLKLALDPDAKSEPLAYYSSHTECVRLVPEIENLYISPSVGPQRKAAAIVESSEIRRLVADARQRFDMVIMDTPALTYSNDALLLQPLTDGLIMVTRPGITEGKKLGSMLDQMVEAEMPILGAVINGVDLEPLETYQDEEQRTALPAPPPQPLSTTAESSVLKGDRPETKDSLPPTPVAGKK